MDTGQVREKRKTKNTSEYDQKVSYREGTSAVSENRRALVRNLTAQPRMLESRVTTPFAKFEAPRSRKS